MPASIGVNLRVTGHCRQGGRKYMEDFFSVAYQQTEDERDLEYAFFGIFDGHGGAEAAAFAKEHLMESIVKQKAFWSDCDDDVLRAIKDGYLDTHYAMWREQEKWPKTASGLPSTAGTTASVAFIRRGKIYIGHVGDSGIILGYQEPGCPEWKARPLTKDHKPENAIEISRIEQCGGKVISKSGVPRVVWNRPRIGRQGPVLRSTQIDEIPFLAVARSLGDLWSYNSQLNEFIVSPDPDCSVVPIDTDTFRCLVFGTDGLYNMLSPQVAVHIVQQAERHNENAALSDATVGKTWLNPSKCLVEKALERWNSTKIRADNTSVVTLILDPPGPPRAQVLKIKKKLAAYPNSGLQIMTRYEDSGKEEEEEKKSVPAQTCAQPSVSSSSFASLAEETPTSAEEVEVEEEALSPSTYTKLEDAAKKPRESLAVDPRLQFDDDDDGGGGGGGGLAEVVEADSSTGAALKRSEENIQINEISSSSDEPAALRSETKANLRSSLRISKSRVGQQQALLLPDKHAEVRCKRLKNSDAVNKIMTRSSNGGGGGGKENNIRKQQQAPSALAVPKMPPVVRGNRHRIAEVNSCDVRTTRSSSKGGNQTNEKQSAVLLRKLNRASMAIRKAKTVAGKKLDKKNVNVVLKPAQSPAKLPKTPAKRRK